MNKSITIAKVEKASWIDNSYLYRGLAKKSLGDMAAALSAQSEKLEEIKASLSSFDKTAYISQGDFKQNYAQNRRPVFVQFYK